MVFWEGRGKRGGGKSFPCFFPKHVTLLCKRRGENKEGGRSVEGGSRWPRSRVSVFELSGVGEKKWIFPNFVKKKG